MGWLKRGSRAGTGRDGGDGGEANRRRSLGRAVAVRRPSASLLICVVALFVALGGTSYAALTVTGKNVKDSSLTTKDIKDNSLTSSDVKDRSLRLRDFRSGELSGGDRLGRLVLPVLPVLPAARSHSPAWPRRARSTRA